MPLLDEMRTEYPAKSWSVDENGMVGFLHAGMHIVNPFAGSPPWVEVDPVTEYRISTEHAQQLREHNSKCPDWAW